jgi:hypothetical protein
VLPVSIFECVDNTQPNASESFHFSRERGHPEGGDAKGTADAPLRYLLAEATPP